MYNNYERAKALLPLLKEYYLEQEKLGEEYSIRALTIDKKEIAEKLSSASFNHTMLSLLLRSMISLIESYLSSRNGKLLKEMFEDKSFKNILGKLAFKYYKAFPIDITFDCSEEALDDRTIALMQLLNKQVITKERFILIDILQRSLAYSEPFQRLVELDSRGQIDESKSNYTDLEK